MDRFLIIGLLLCLGNVLPEPPTADRLWTSRSIHPRSVRFDSRQSLLPVVALRGGRNTEREGKPDIFQRYGIVSDASEEDTGEEGEGQNDELGDGVQTELGEEDKVRMREEWEAFQHMTMAGGDEPKSPKELVMEQLEEAAREGDASLLRSLLPTNSAERQRCLSSMRPLSPLMLACLAGSRECVEALLEAGADPRQRTPQQAQSALHLAAAAGHVPVCRILLDAAPEVPPSSYPPFSFPLSLELSGRREGAVRSARDVGCGCRVCRVLVYVHVCVCVCGRVWSGRTASGAAPCTMLPMRGGARCSGCCTPLALTSSPRARGRRRGRSWRLSAATPSPSIRSRRSCCSCLRSSARA